MKHLALLVLAIATLASLTGCGHKEEIPAGTTVQTSAPDPNAGGGEGVGTGIRKIGQIKKN